MGIRQQPKMHWSAYLWPGFPHLWNRGSWAGLALAVGFTVLLNVLLVAKLVWTEWMSPGARQVGFGVLVVIWSLAWLESRADWRRYLAEWGAGERANLGTAATGSSGVEGGEDPEEDEFEERSDKLFHDAQRQYLAGDWVRCEQQLRQLLKMDKRDVEAQLMLATLWRHLGRTEEAVRQLRRLERMEAAVPWNYEIAHEFDEIARELDESSRQSDGSGDACGTPTRSGQEKRTGQEKATIKDEETATRVAIEDQPAHVEQQQTNDQSPLAA